MFLRSGWGVWVVAALRLTISRQEETHPKKAHPPKKNALFEPVIFLVSA